MADSSLGRFAQVAVVIAFAASIVLLGAREMRGSKWPQQSKRAAGTKGSLLKVEGGKQESVRSAFAKINDEKRGLLSPARGAAQPEVKASISRQALREPPAKSTKRGEDSILSGLFPGLGRKTVTEHSDNLSSEDRKQLDELLVKVAK